MLLSQLFEMFLEGREGTEGVQQFYCDRDVLWFDCSEWGKIASRMYLPKSAEASVYEFGGDQPSGCIDK